MKFCVNCNEEYDDSIKKCPTCDCPYQPVKYEEILTYLDETIRLFETQHEGRRGTFTARNYGTIGGLRHSKNLFDDVVFTNMDRYSDGDMKIETSHDKYHITNISPSIMECLIDIVQSCDNNSIDFQALKDTMQHLPELKPHVQRRQFVYYDGMRF